MAVGSLEGFMLDRGFLTSAELSKAQHVCTETGERLVTAVRRLGIVAGSDLARAVATYYALPTVGEQDWPKTTLLSDVLSPRYLREHKVLPLAVDGSAWCWPPPTRATPPPSTPFSWPRAGDRAARRTCRGHRRCHRPLQAARGGAGTGAAQPGARATTTSSISTTWRWGPGGPFRQSADPGRPQLARHRHPCRAVPRPLHIRLRIDGMLTRGRLGPGPHGTRHRLAHQDLVRPRHRRAAPAAGRPRANQRRRARALDLRIATMPTIHGEAVAIRLLDNVQRVLDFAKLGFQRATKRRSGANLAAPHGLMLVTGPTGSGKTTTLATSLHATQPAPPQDPHRSRTRSSTSSRASTRPRPNPRSVCIRQRAALFLRHDPDVIMVGEMRDAETAQHRHTRGADRPSRALARCIPTRPPAPFRACSTWGWTATCSPRP